MNKILIDAFGGDNAPKQIIEGTLDAIKEKEGWTAVLVGDKNKIEEILKDYSFESERVEIIDAKEVITCEEEPTVAVRTKPDSSICVAFKELKENPEAKAFVSAGSTGAVLVGATLKLGRLKSVNRPALCPVMPTKIDGKKVYLMDSGANADCKPINLCQFALMASAYAELEGVKNPKVALLSNGTEDEKGNALNHEVFPMLKSMKEINFVGNIEGRDILSGEFDVIVADGFSGNVALKSMEGAINVLFGEIKGCLKGLRGKLAGLLLKSKLMKIKKKLDYNDQGGALFLGVEKPVVKAHGASKANAFKNAVLQAVSFAEKDMPSKMKEKLSALDLEAFKVNNK